MNLYLLFLIINFIVILILVYIILKYRVIDIAYKQNKEELSKEFKLLANQIFEDKSKQFSHTHKEQFESLLKPFRE